MKDVYLEETFQFPAKLFAVAVLFTAFTLSWMSWEIVHLQKTNQATRVQEQSVLELQKQILYLDEVLTMSARMAASTGNPEWESRYLEFEPQLDVAIKKAEALFPKAYYGEAAMQTDLANQKLVTMEKIAFDYVREGKLHKAQALMFGEEYEKQKGIYAQGMAYFAESKAVNLRLKELVGTIIHYDEVLTMSARMAATTGDLDWEKRYRSFELKLDRAISEAIKLTPNIIQKEFTQQTDAANQALIAMENQAFDLIRKGQKQNAEKVLFSKAYEEQKQIYAKGMKSFTESINKAIASRTQIENRKTSIILVILLTLMPTLCICWFSVFRYTKHWKKNT